MITPLPAARPSAFSTRRVGGARRSRSSASSRVASDGVRGGRDAGLAPSASLARTFEPSSSAAAALGPNAAMPASSSASTTPATSGASGPTTTRSTRARRRRGDDRVDVVGGDIEAAGVGGDPGVAGRAEQLRRVRRAGQRADDRVLAPAAADDEDLHAVGVRRSERVGEVLGRDRGQRLVGHRPARAELDRDLGHRLGVGGLDDVTKSYWPSVAHWSRTLAPICSTSLFTSATRAGCS